jgi:hypothetical protein
MKAFFRDLDFCQRKIRPIPLQRGVPEEAEAEKSIKKLFLFSRNIVVVSGIMFSSSKGLDTTLSNA